MLISPSCTMPSRLTSSTSSKWMSTALQACTHDGRLRKLVPTTCVYTSYLTSRASAGAMKYSRRMNSSDQHTERRASPTDGVVYERISMCGMPAVPSIRHSTSARKLMRMCSRSRGSSAGNGSACGTGGVARASKAARACDQSVRASSTVAG